MGRSQQSCFDHDGSVGAVIRLRARRLRNVNSILAWVRDFSRVLNSPKMLWSLPRLRKSAGA